MALYNGEFMENTVKTIYLTLIHAALALSWFLYTSDTYTLARIDHAQHAENLQKHAY